MPIQHVKSEYLIPRGKVYFDPFDANEQLTGEFPLGNCPGASCLPIRLRLQRLLPALPSSKSPDTKQQAN